MPLLWISETHHEAERFQGWHEENILVVVDEASGVPEPIYEAVEGILTGPNARLLLIGNPNNAAGTFYDAFRSSLYDPYHIQASEIPDRVFPNVEGWIAERREEWGEESPVYQVRVLGQFPDQGEDSLFSMRDVVAAQERDGTLDGRGDVEIGADIARYGADESVAFVRRGPAVIAAARWRGSDTMASAGRIAKLARDLAVRTIKVDDIGVGSGVVDRLTEEFRRSGVAVVGVNVGEAATDKENYFNRRAEIFAGLAERFKQGDISIPKDDTLLLDQLVAIRKIYTPRGQMKLPSKEDMRKDRGSTAKWRSPDRADALAICFAPAGRGYRPAVATGPGRPMPRVVK